MKGPGNLITGGDWKNFDVRDRKSTDCLNQIVGRNMNVKGIFGEGAEGNEEYFIGNWKKHNPC